MKTMKLIIDGNSEVVQIERYFRALGNQYLIYSKDGADIDGNVRINIVKIEHDQVVPILEASEWDALKKVIVEIVNDNRELSKLSIEDLDYQYLENLNITDAKALRLPGAIMPYLSANQPDFNSLEVKEQQLDAKVEALKDMNHDLSTMMDEVGKEFTAAKNQPLEDQTEEKMSATMEIIMPSKQLISEAKETKPAQPKEKGHFNFKNLFGKKKNKEEEEVTIEQAPVQEEKIETPVVEENIKPETTLENSLEQVEKTLETMDHVEPTLESIVKDTVEEDTKNDESDTGFDFFGQSMESITPEPIVVTPMTSMPVEIPDIPENSAANEEEVMEILELEEDEYEEKYAEEQKKVAQLEEKVQELNENIKRLEENLLQYQQKFDQIKGIVEL